MIRTTTVIILLSVISIACDREEDRYPFPYLDEMQAEVLGDEEAGLVTVKFTGKLLTGTPVPQKVTLVWGEVNYDSRDYHYKQDATILDTGEFAASAEMFYWGRFGVTFYFESASNASYGVTYRYEPQKNLLVRISPEKHSN